jgi:hypothetical protein
MVMSVPGQIIHRFVLDALEFTMYNPIDEDNRPVVTYGVMLIGPISNDFAGKIMDGKVSSTNELFKHVDKEYDK